MKKEEIVEDVVTDLILDDVMNETTLVEGNVAHDEKGRFSGKGASTAYQFGIMAAGRAAGMHAKAEGKSREDVRAAIKHGMDRHMERVGIHPHEKPTMAKIRSALRYNGGRNATQADIRGVGKRSLDWARGKQ